MKLARRLGIIFFLVPWSLIVGCATLGYNKSMTPAQKARLAVADIADGLKQSDKTIQQLHTQGIVSDTEAIKLESFIRQGTVVNDQLNACVDQMKSAVPGTAEAVTATACVNGVLSSFKTQEAQAVVGIKSPEAQSAFNASLGMFDTGIGILNQAVAEFSAVR